VRGYSFFTMKTEVNWLDPAMVLPGPSQGPVLVEWSGINRFGHCFATYDNKVQGWRNLPQEAEKVAGWAILESMDQPF
jgi:hypothetical protein